MAIVAGGFLAGIIAHVLGVAAPLFFTAGTAVLGALLYLVFVPHAGFSQDGQPATRLGMAEIGRLFKRSGFVMVNVTNLAYLWMIAAVIDTLIPLFARDELGMSTVGIGVVLAVLLAAELVVLYPAGSLADRKGRRFVMVPALAALAITTVVVGWTDTVILFGIVLALLGVASGFAGVPPAAMLAGRSRRARTTRSEWGCFASPATSASPWARSSPGSSRRSRVSGGVRGDRRADARRARPGPAVRGDAPAQGSGRVRRQDRSQ